MKAIIKKTVFQFAGISFLAIMLVAFSSLKIGEGWQVPDAAKNMKNPVANSADVTAAAQILWAKHCKSCHGKTGEGDGPKAEDLDSECGDFTEDAFQAQTDGELFFKLTEGRDDMPGFKKKIPDEEERWKLVHYLRTFK